MRLLVPIALVSLMCTACAARKQPKVYMPSHCVTTVNFKESKGRLISDSLAVCDHVTARFGCVRTGRPPTAH
jgi:hypothetical protein